MVHGAFDYLDLIWGLFGRASRAFFFSVFVFQVEVCLVLWAIGWDKSLG